jgi:hypothetical protein
MEKNIKWVDVQKMIKHIFSTSKMRNFKDVLEKDVKGWNWVLDFEDLRTDTSLIIHTKFIFKLDEKKEFLRKLDFLYLKDINCLYKIVSFDSSGHLENSIKEILNKNLFGENLMSLSQFLIEPDRNMNQYFYEHNIKGVSIFSFIYEPFKEIVPCQDMEFNFKINVNNVYEIKMKILKKKKGVFDIIYSHMGKEWVIQQEKLNNLVEVSCKFIIDKVLEY